VKFKEADQRGGFSSRRGKKRPWAPRGEAKIKSGKVWGNTSDRKDISSTPDGTGRKAELG